MTHWVAVNGAAPADPWKGFPGFTKRHLRGPTAALDQGTEKMTRKMREGSVSLEALQEEPHLLTEPPGESFDWVDFRCRCPSCGTTVDGFRTKDFCRQLDRVDYRTAYGQGLADVV